uniref:Odorant-binding protein n=1 Tax=Galeruca daurica TaxID=1651263 RepID=A0A1U9W515_9CUCU|nr:odorant-binding protein [Galeruca daurica]
MVKEILLLVVVCFISSSFSAVPEHHFSPTLLSIYQDWQRRCRMYTGTTEELIKQTQEGKFPEDESIKRYTDCLYTHHDYMVGPDNIVDTRKLKYLLPEGSEAILESVRKCNLDLVNAGETNLTELLWNMHKCYHDNIDPSLYYFY